MVFALRPVDACPPLAREAHCVNNSEGRKIANAHKGFAEGVQKEKPLVIRNDNYNNAEKHDNNATFVHCMQSQKDAKKHDNKVVLTPCVKNSDTAHKGLKPLVIRNKDAKNINNNVAFVHCVQIQNFDSLSRKIKNPCSVINNFKLKEDILMRISKTKNFLNTILMAALSLIVIFAVSCGDKPTGSTPGAEDEFISSVPSPKGESVGGSDALFHSSGKEYSLTLTFIESEWKFESDNVDEENLKNDIKNNTSYTLGITNGKVAFSRPESSSTYTIFSNAQLLKKNGDIYNAGVPEVDNGEGYTSSEKHYIEFKSADGNTLTDFKYEFATSVKGSYDYGFIAVYKQQ